LKITELGISEVPFLLNFGITPFKYMYLTEIDDEGVIAADTDPAQEMGDESVEVFYLLFSLGTV